MQILNLKCKIAEIAVVQSPHSITYIVARLKHFNVHCFVSFVVCCFFLSRGSVCTITQCETDMVLMWLSNLNLKCSSYCPP